MEPADQLKRVTEFRSQMASRRTVRDFCALPFPVELIEKAIATATTAPSGANQQPWRFVVVSGPDLKRQIRIAAEAEERENYENRFPQEWLDALTPFGTDWQKPFLEICPYSKSHGFSRSDPRATGQRTPLPPHPGRLPSPRRPIPGPH